MSEETNNTAKGNSFVGFLILGVCLVIIFGGLGWYNYRAFFNSPDYLEPGNSDCIALNASITGRAKPLGYKNTGATMKYSYQVNGQVFEQKEDVDESTYYLYYERDSVRICARRGEPGKSNIVGNIQGTSSKMKVILIDVIMLVVVIIVAIQARRISRREED